MKENIPDLNISHNAVGRLKASAYLPLLSLLGFSAGVANGLLGAAGGILLVVFLPIIIKNSRFSSSLKAMESRDIFASAICVMLPITVISSIVYFLNGTQASIKDVVFLAIPASIGGFIGAILLGKISTGLLKKLFAVLVIISGLRMIM